MDIEKIFEMIERAEKSSFNKITIETGDIKLNLERNFEAPAAYHAPAQKDKAPAVSNESENGELVFAPISGVFYVAKEPGAEPFVKPGTKVNKGDTLCIIEAMKTMNEISAPKTGIIESVLKKDTEAIVAKDAIFRYAR